MLALQGLIRPHHFLHSNLSHSRFRSSNISIVPIAVVGDVDSRGIDRQSE
ncbi:predicted protein [Plenodomus lingam JN3]|uniref:Predicted protein n=1 Tax=Leptosphaeria maculans (strain JN3 / isolate v23.1.3 / race Av1-4-5-6-7-8) TaxID=985895 RepID=E4ZS48_LEPMJ|nr:predicted protein [Plenodomus lingam JN3]CBX94228.1 predicted protein [Plenodomus lingam JN3]